MSFDALKKNRNSAIAGLVAAAEKLATNKSYTDDRFWSPTVDKAGNGYAVIRFLPAPEGEALPWIRYWDHGFKGSTGRWYIENSLTSIDQPDPVSESNSILWNSGLESDKEIARKRKRRLHYVSNILVVSDPGNRENEGKVFLYKYGKKIFDKLMDVMTPTFPGDVAVNPFDLWDGADFRLKIRNVEDYRNYDKSELAPASPVSADENRMKEIYEALNSLQTFLQPSNYKTYAELKRKLETVLGESVGTATMSPRQLMDHDNTAEAPARRSAPAREPETIGGGHSDLDSDDGIPDFMGESAGDDDGDSLAYFAKLAKGGK
jgi:hypothetical protein